MNSNNFRPGPEEAPSCVVNGVRGDVGGGSEGKERRLTATQFVRRSLTRRRSAHLSKPVGRSLLAASRLHCAFMVSAAD